MSQKNSANRRANVYRKLVLAAAIAAPASLASAQAVWVGPSGGGLWGEPSNWDTNFAPVFAGGIGRVDGNKPQNTDVLIDGGFTISNIIIDAGDQVRLGNGQQIVFNESAVTLQQDGLAIAANGTFTVQAGTQNTDLNIPAGNNIVFEGVQGNGGGVVNLTSNGGAGSSRITGSGTLTNNITIQGVGQIGFNALRLNNTGLIQASGGVLSIDVVNLGGSVGGLVNTGSMGASNGGELVLTGNGAGFYDNAGGSLFANNNSFVTLVSSADVRGGSITSSGNGQVRVAANDVALVSNVSIVGNLTVSNNAILFAGGTYSNSGSINVNAGTNNAVLSMNSGTVTLNGAGIVNLNRSGAGDAQIGGSGTLITSNTIQGAGNVGANAIFIRNTGLVLANNASGLTIDPVNLGGTDAGFVNNGSLQANGGVLFLTGNGAGFFNNAGGRIIAGSTDVQLVTSVDIRGGSFNSSGAGVIRMLTGNVASISNITNTGNITVDPNAILQVGGTITNNGSMNINSGTNTSASLSPAGGSVSVAGSGVINMIENGGGAYLQGGGTFVINQLVRGSGNVGLNNTAFTNNNLIRADVAATPLTIDPANLGGANAGFTNAGSLQANGGVLNLTGNGAGFFNNTAGQIIAGSTDVQLVTSVDIRGGTITSTGAGIVRVPTGNVASVSNLTNTGNLTSDPNAILQAGGTITNTGSVNVNSGTNTSSSLSTAGGSFTIGGAGFVNLNEAGGGAYIQGGGTFINNQTVRGSGNVGLNNTAITNNGTMVANTSVFALTVDAANLGGAVAGATNNGTLLANGGVLNLTGNGAGFFDNSIGRIIAGSTDVQLVTSVDVRGGTMTSSGAGVVRVPSGNTAYINGVTNTGNLTADPNSLLAIVGAGFVNNGSVNINSGTNTSTSLYSNAGTAILSGSGVVNLNEAGGGAYIQGGGTFINNSAIRGAGNIGLNNTFVSNTGTINATNAAFALTIDAVNLGGGTPGMTNTGTLLASGGELRLTGNGAGYFSGAAGTISVASNGTLTLETSADVRVGNIVLNGVLNHTSSSSLTANYVRGGGTLNVNTSSLLKINQNGTAAGTSRVSSMTINAAKVDLTDNDMVIDYTGASPQTTVRGYLQSGLNGGSWNGNGLITSVATNNKRIGYAEAPAIFSSFPATFSGQTVDNTSVLIKYTYAGDADLNGVVNFDDYSRTDTGFNTGGSVWSQGDFDYNGHVNFDDYAMIDLAFNTQSGTLRRAMTFLEGGDRSQQGMNSPSLQVIEEHFAQFGSGYASSFLNAVPEPTSVVISGVVAVSAMVGCRRRRR